MLIEAIKGFGILSILFEVFFFSVGSFSLLNCGRQHYFNRYRFMQIKSYPWLIFHFFQMLFQMCISIKERHKYFKESFIWFFIFQVWCKQHIISVNWEIIKKLLIKWWLVPFILIGIGIIWIGKHIRSYKKPRKVVWYWITKICIRNSKIRDNIIY